MRTESLLKRKCELVPLTDNVFAKPSLMMRSQRYIKGHFISEGDTRFVAFVKVHNKVVKCYVPTSTKLSHYVFVSVGDSILLHGHGGKYSLDYIKVRGRWIGVNSSLATYFLAKRLKAVDINVKREQKVGKYRFDLVAAGIYYEVKSIITDAKTVLFPNARSERRLDQLCKIRSILRSNVPVELSFVALSPTLRTLYINTRSRTGKLLLAAIKSGLRVSCWRLVRRSALENVPVVFVSINNINKNW